MNVTINGKNDTVDGAMTVLDLLKLKDVEAPDMVSVQINGEIVEKEKFGATQIAENDEIEFLYFMGGGSRSASRVSCAGKGK